ncbi:MAG: hypothetical protein JRH01_11355 [Deltaproteobacteria bacterium]|nr:hypothetical protein [Deltaproteobacteria bacterium]MBW2393600.1 hypothetical protein [Deltaproteobacteria bacterium]
MVDHPVRARLAISALAALTLLAAVLGSNASQAARAKSVANEAQWVSFDPEAKTVTLEILTEGKGNKALAKKFKRTVKRGKQVTINVIPEGSIRERTSVAIHGRMATLGDIKAGKRVVLYWIEDPRQAGELFARKIDVLFSREELRERYRAEGAGE